MLPEMAGDLAEYYDILANESRIGIATIATVLEKLLPAFNRTICTYFGKFLLQGVNRNWR